MVNVALDSDRFGNKPEAQVSELLMKLTYKITEQNRTEHNTEYRRAGTSVTYDLRL